MYIWDCSFFSFFFANLCIANVSFRIMHLFATVWYIKPRQNWISVQIPGSKCTEYSRNVAALIANLMSFLPYSVCHFVLLLFCAVESIKEDSTSPYNWQNSDEWNNLQQNLVLSNSFCSAHISQYDTLHIQGCQRLGFFEGRGLKLWTYYLLLACRHVSSTYILHFCHNQRSHIQSSQAAAALAQGGRQHGQCLFQQHSLRHLSSTATELNKEKKSPLH